ncbi:MAG TPA: sigma-70 family RNA polymerase sigma factor [Kofleriaceae bacterium]
MEPTEVAVDVERARSGDRAAFARLYERFHRVVHAVILARVGASEASDLVQDAFADAWARVSTLRDAAAFPGWMLQIARNRAVDHLRVRRVTTVADPDDIGIEPPPTTEAARALRAIRALPETYSETLIMRLVEGLDGPEIAARTGMTPGSVRVNLHRGMELLREQLAPSATRAKGSAR